jgi:coenzyme F420 biosynthesis associated uncharacterized protein
LSELVDWGLARRVAAVAAGGGSESGDLGSLDSTVERASAAVRDYTGLSPDEGVPAAEWVSRREWAAVNLESIRRSLGPVELRLRGAAGSPPAAGGALGGALSLVAGAQLGADIGYSSRRVLGQYEFPVLDPEHPARLLFVAENVGQAGAELGGKPGAALRWIALHEVTHAVHFAVAPWLREHLRDLVGELLEGSRIGIGRSEIAAAAGRIARTDPRDWIADLWNSDPLTLLAAPESRPLLERAQATMAAIEGYAEHVMDAAGDGLVPSAAAMRERLEGRRRGRSLPLRLVSWLFGFELKLRQYERGKRFCDAVVADAGIEGLNAAWSGPTSLPEPSELSAPGLWLGRVRPAAAAA